MSSRAVGSKRAPAAPLGGDGPSDARYARWVSIFLLVVVGIIYGQTLDHELLGYDDSAFVQANPHVTAGLTGKGVYWAFVDGPFGEWYPLAVLSHMVDCQIFGLHAWGHHLTSVLLHAATSVVLFRAWWRYTDELWPSALVATIFAVHPQHVESVAWVAERRDVLSGLFFVLTLAAYLGYVRRGRTPWRYLLVAVLFALALLAKAMVVTLVPLLLLLDYWPLARIGSADDAPRWTHSIERPSAIRLVLEKLPLLALVAGDCLMTMRTHFSGATSLPFEVRARNAAVSCVDYVMQFVFPVDLAACYPFPWEGAPLWKVAGALAIVAAISAAAAIWRRRCPYCFVGWFWYLGMVFPVLGVVKIGWLARADRYMYLPGIGLSIVLVWSATRYCARSPDRRWMFGGCAGLAIATLTVLAALQTSYWHDEETLWAHALACTTDNSGAELGLGYALARQNRLDEAVAEFRRALAIEPDSFLGHLNLGVALVRQGKIDEAEQHYRRSLEIDPRGVKAYLALSHLLAHEGKFAEARSELERAAAIEPNNAAVQNDLGTVLFQLGKFDESIPHYEAALAVDPDFVLAHVNLADALAARGRIDEARLEYRRALQLEPNHPEALRGAAKLPEGSIRRPAP